MKYQALSLYNSVSKEFFDFTVKEYAKQFDVSGYKFNSHPQEDSFCSSKKLPIFCVGDGVTLDPKPGEKYPNPSGAFFVTDKFIKTVVKESEKNYKKFNLQKLKEIFQKGNQEVKKINEKFGRIKNKINYLDFDLFCATAAFGVIKKDKLYWFTIADSFIAIFNRAGKQKFVSPNGWRFMQMPKKLEGTERNVYIRKYLRNGFRNNKKIGYGVISGEQKAIKYLDYGVEKINNGDLIFIGTDGYERYVKLKKFVSLFVARKPTKQQTEKLEQDLIKKDCNKYGHERTMFVIRYQN